jgi:hypothetical protein
MDEIYRAKDTRLDRAIAIKFLSSNRSVDFDRRARFEREEKPSRVCRMHGAQQNLGQKLTHRVTHELRIGTSRSVVTKEAV